MIFTRKLIPLDQRGPLRVMFLITSMPVGGAETLLVNLIRRMDRNRFSPQVCCLKERGPLGEELANEIPVHERMIGGKYDIAVVNRLNRLLLDQQIDAVVTVGAGDKMFWGRLAAKRARVPVICSALHSTGWPDGVGRMNRMLTPITDAFIAVANSHGEFLRDEEKFPASKVHVIPNGVDTDRFQFSEADRTRLRSELGISHQAPVMGIVAALRPEKNHLSFLRVAARVASRLPGARYLIVGDGPERPKLEIAVSDLALKDSVKFLGSRNDVPELLSAIDLFVLTSNNEASPVSILEAMSMGLPVVATDVGSVSENVRVGETGYLAPAGNSDLLAQFCLQALEDRQLCASLGRNGRAHVEKCGSLQAMVKGYEDLLTKIYGEKCQRQRFNAAAAVASAENSVAVPVHRDC
jgi:glycosyltransferase involved in cell wall biosynthesis